MRFATIPPFRNLPGELRPHQRRQVRFRRGKDAGKRAKVQKQTLFRARPDPRNVPQRAVDLGLAAELPVEGEAESVAFLKTAEEEWAKPHPKFYEFAIIHDGEHIGGISIHMEYGKPVLGWIINRKYWGRGFAYESAKAVMEHFASDLGIRYFCAYCDTRNTASFRLMEKLGMKRAGESGGRKNRASPEEAFEYKYEIDLDHDVK